MTAIRATPMMPFEQGERPVIRTVLSSMSRQYHRPDGCPTRATPSLPTACC